MTIHSSPSLIALRLQAGEVGAGAGLAEELAPRLLAGDDVAHVEVDLLLRAVGGDRGRRQQQPEAAGRAERAELGDGVLHGDAVVAVEALAVGVLAAGPGAAQPARPRRSHHSRDGEVGIPVLLEPGRDLGDGVGGLAGALFEVGHRSPWIGW